MLCYRDRTFCGSPNCKNECGSKFTQQDQLNAVKWWGGEDAPVAFSEFCDDNGNLKKEYK